MASVNETPPPPRRTRAVTAAKRAALLTKRASIENTVTHTPPPSRQQQHHTPPAAVPSKRSVRNETEYGEPDGERTVDSDDNGDAGNPATTRRSESSRARRHRPSGTAVTSARQSIGSRSTEQKRQHAELVQSVLAGGYIVRAGKSVSELARRLQHTWTVLQRIANHEQQQQHDNDDDSSGIAVDSAATDASLAQLRLVCIDLLQEHVLTSDDPLVQSLAACCFAELLRAHAPQSPFASNEELYDAFQLIIEQLRRLADADGESASADAASAAHRVQLLESLASARSCTLLVGVDFRVDSTEDVLLVQLFRVLFDALQPTHSSHIQELMVTVLVACINELDLIDQPLLDVILAPLVRARPSDTTSNAATARGAYHMAQELIRRTSEQLESPLSHFFNSVLADASAAPAPSSSSSVSAALAATSSSALKEHVYALMYEVHRARASLLAPVLPSVCLQLQVDEVATRAEAVALLARLFASRHAAYAVEHAKTFRDFLGRFRDANTEIRLQMVQACAVVWPRQHALGAALEPEFVARLSDPEWEVRRAVVHALCDLAATDLTLVSHDALRAVGERMKDKRVLLRKETMTGLSQVYAAHVSAYWSVQGPDASAVAVAETEITHSVPPAVAKKLAWVPDYVLKCFAYPQQELKLRVVQLLDDILLPKAANDAVRAMGLLYVFHALDAAAREALRRIWSERAQCQRAVRAFVVAKQRLRAKGLNGSNARNADDTDASATAATERLVAALTPLFPETTHLRKLLEQLSASRDHSVFAHLTQLCDSAKSSAEMRAARDRLVKSVGSKSPLGDFMKTLCRKLNLLTLHQVSVRVLLRALTEPQQHSGRELRHVAELLVLVSKVAPEVFAPFVRGDLETILLPAGSHEGGDSDEDNDGTGEVNDDTDDDADDHRQHPRVVEGALGMLANYSEHWKATQRHAGAVTGDTDADALEPLDASATPSRHLTKQLEHLCLTPSASVRDVPGHSAATLAVFECRVAKLAAQSLANFVGAPSALLQQLCSKKHLASPTTPHVLAALRSLAVFAKRCGAVLATKQPLLESLWTALTDNFLTDAAADTGAEPQSKPRKRAVTHAKLVAIRCLALKVAVNIVAHCGGSSETREATDRSARVVELLFELLRSDGRKWTLNAGLAAKYRVAAASNLLTLMRCPHIERVVTVAQWHVLGFVVQDSSEDVRAAFLAKLTVHLVKHAPPHPHRYVSYLTLAASEPNATLKKQARAVLVASIERMRRAFETAVARGSDSGSGVSGRDSAALLVPEYALPYVIHLLAHHPDFPTAAVHRSGRDHMALTQNPEWSRQVLHLSFFLDALVAAGDNIAFVLQLLAQLAECDDATDADSSVHTHALVGTAALLVKKKIRHQASLQPFPGRIFVPKQLFVTGRARPASGATVGVRDSISGSGDVGTQRTPRMMTSLSPIKASDIRDHFMVLTSPLASLTKKRRASAGTPNAKRKAQKTLSTTPRASAAARGDNNGDGDGEAAPRRASLMRQARTQSLPFVDASSESDADNPNDLLPGVSVAARSSQLQPAALGVNDDDGDDDAMTSFRSGRRRRAP